MDTLLQALQVSACDLSPALLQVWSWVYENGAYRTASLAETSATSTESNAVQVGCLRRSAAAVILHGTAERCSPRQRVLFMHCRTHLLALQIAAVEPCLHCRPRPQRRHAAGVVIVLLARCGIPHRATGRDGPQWTVQCAVEHLWTASASCAAYAVLLRQPCCHAHRHAVHLSK